MIRICVSGSRGKMGSRIIALAREDRDIEVAGAFDIDGDPEQSIGKCDCLIDFTAPKATVEHCAICERHKKAMVIGTTGLSEADTARIRQASRVIPLVLSPNMSIGVNLLFKLVRDAARTLGAPYRVSIREAHHVHKKDAPSGTAKELARVIRETRDDRDIPIQSIREDEIVGDHTVFFESPYDTLQLVHSAKTRDIFALGALTAAKYISRKKAGLYSMKDVLGL